MMQEITYASKSIVTTDAVADALLDLVTAIDRHDHSEAVTVPAFTESGERVEARMTIDASSELVAVPVSLDIVDDEATDDAITAAIRDIRARSEKNRSTVVGRARPVLPGSGGDLSYIDDL